MFNGGEGKSKMVGISMLLLSLLLTGSVAALIYMAVANGHEACKAAAVESSGTDITASINIDTGDKKVSEGLVSGRLCIIDPVLI